MIGWSVSLITGIARGPLGRVPGAGDPSTMAMAPGARADAGVSVGDEGPPPPGRRRHGHRRLPRGAGPSRGQTGAA
jgi:hypothetical protein